MTLETLAQSLTGFVLYDKENTIQPEYALKPELVGISYYDAPLTPTPRPYTEPYEYCTFCGACVRRCPVDAISVEAGKNNLTCGAFVDDTRVTFAPRYGCGKCQLNVPCESRIP